MIDEKCENKGCSNAATKITTTETRFIQICSECYYDKYKS